MSTIHYKFKSSLDYQSVTFDGIHISLADLKKAISHQKRLKPGEYNLVITNAQTREVYKNEEDLIPKNTSVIVSRIPVAATSTTNSTSKAWEKFKEDCARAIQQEKEKEMISLEQLNNTADLVNARATEMDKIKAAINQSTRDFDPSNYKSKLPTGTPPNTYTCYKCGKQGHFIHACPLKDSDAPGVIEPRFKRSTGIPNSFLTLTDNPMQPGALLTHTGHFAVPTLDADAYRVGKKERPPFLPQPESEIQQPQQPQIPPALQCPLCKELLRDAVVTPCCGNSFCDECIRNGLLETEDHECPVCHEVEVSPSQLIPNKFHRDAVSKFVNNTSYNQPKSGGAGPAPVTSMMNQHSVAPSLNMPPSSMGQPFRNTLPPGPLHPPSIHPQVQHPPPHRPPQVQHPPPHRPPPQVPTQMTVPPPTQPPPAMPPVEPRPPPQVAALKVESSDPNARRSLSPGERPPTPTRDENSQSATSDDEPRGMAVQVVGTRVGNSIQLTGSDHVPGNDFDHGRQPRGGRGYERRDRERNWDREGRGERKYEGRGDRHMEGRGDRNFERRGDRSYKGRGEGNFERHDRPDHYPKDNYKGSNYEGPPPREPQPNITNPPPLIPPPVKSEPPPFPPFPGPPPQMNIPPPGFGPPPPHVLPPTSGPPPAPIPVVGHSSGGFPPMVYPSGLPPAFPPQVNPYPGRRPLSEAEFYKEKARLLQESLPPPPIAVRPQRDMMDDFHKELLAYSQDQKRRQNIVAKPKSKSRSRSRSKSRPRSRSRSRSRPRSRSKSRVKSRGSRSRSRSKSWVRSRTRSKSRSRGRSRSRNRKLSRSRSHTPRLRSRSRSKSYSRSPRPRLRSRSRTRSLRRSRSRSPRPRSRTRSPWRSRSRSRTPRRRFSRSRSRSRSRPRYRSFSRSRSRSLSRSPRYARSRSRSPYRRRSPFYSRSKSPLRPKSPIKSQNLRRDRWTPPPYRSFRDPPEPPPPPPGEGVPPPLMGLPFRHYSPPPDRYGYLPYQDRGLPPPPDPYYRYDAHPYENPFDDFFRFGRNGPPPHGAPGPGYPYMDGMARDPRSKSPRRRGGRSPGRAGRGRRDRNQDFNRNRNPECRNQDFYNRDQDFERGNRHEDMHKRDDNSQEAKPERRRGEADRRSRDKGKDKEKKKDSKDNKENADVKVKKESSTRKDKETSQKGSVDKDVKRVKKRHGKDGSDSDSNVNAQKITKPGNLIQVKIESIPEETKKSSSSEKGRKKDPLPKKTVKSDSEKPTGKKPIGSKSKEVKKPDRPVASTDKSDHEKPKKARMEKCISNDGNQSDNMPGKLRVKTKKKKTTKLAAAGGAESSGADDKADANVDTSEKRRKLKRTTPDIPEDIPEEDTESPAKRLKMDDEVEGTQVSSKTAAPKDEDMLPVPEPSKWEREDYEEDSSSPARKMKRSSDKKPLPKSVIESAEKVLSQKPMRPTSVASAVSAPVQTKPHRRVYLDEEPMATDDDDRRVMNKQKSIEITISQADRARGDGKSKSDRRDSDDRRVDRTTSVSKLRSDDDRKSGRKTSTGSIKDRLGKRGDGASKDLEKPGRERGNQDYGGDNSRFDGSRSKEEEQSDKGGKTVKASRERIRSNRDSRDSRAHSNSRERSEQSAKSKSSQDGSKETKGEKSTRVIDRKESLIDEATFEPDYDEADSDSENASASEDPAKPGNAEESGMESSEDEEDSSPSKRRSKDGDDKKHKKHKKHKHKHKHKHKKRKHKKHKEGKEKDK